MALKADSAVPAAISAYHAALDSAESACETLSKLAHLWRAFQFYLEPHVLQYAWQVFQPWPVYQHALAAYAGLLYPQLFQDVNRPDAPSPESGLADWHAFFWPPKAPRLSVCILARNARDTLPDVLAALQGLGDERVVLDTGSEDGTFEWLQTQNLRSLSMPWPENFAQARNVLLEAVHSEWVFFVDADEVLLPDGFVWLQSFCAYFPLGWQIYAGEVLHVLPGRAPIRAWVSRLFRHDLPGICFTGALHEVPVKSSDPAWFLPVWGPYQLQHSGHLPEAKRRHRKAERVAWLEALVADPEHVTPYLLYQLAHVLAWGHDVAVDLARASALLERAWSETIAWHGVLPPRWDWVPAPVPAVLLLRMQLALWLHEPRTLVHVGEQWGTLCPYREADVLYAMGLMQLQQPEEAAQACYRSWLPESWSLGEEALWQGAALEVLLDSALQRQDGLQAIFAIRRLQEICPTGASPRGVDLLSVQRQLESLLKLPAGGWLERLQSEMVLQSHREGEPAFRRLAWLLLAGLTEVWRKDWLQKADEVLQKAGLPLLAEQAAILKDLLFPDDLPRRRWPPEAYTLPLGEQAYWRHLLEPVPRKPRVWGALMVRNAADTLPAALASLNAWVDKILIADTGSEDQTPEIIRSWAGAHKVEHWQEKWQDDFSAIRQSLLARAECEWLLMLDADESLVPEGLGFWRNLTAYRAPRRQRWALRCESHLAEGQMRVDWVTRLLHPQPLLRYWGAVHEQPGHVSEPEIWPLLALPQLTLRHVGYLPEAMLRHNKMQRGALLQEMVRNARHDNPYFCYQYAAWLAHQHPAQLEEALASLLRGLDAQMACRGKPPVAGWFPLPLHAALVLLTRLLTQLGRFEELVRLALPWRGYASDPEFFFWLGMAALRTGPSELAYQSLWQAGNLPPGQLPYAGFQTWRPALGLAEWALQHGDWAVGAMAFQRLLGLRYGEAQREWQRWWEQMNQAWNSSPRRSAVS